MFFPGDASAPERLALEDAVLRPLRVPDAERDLDAVLSSAANLRLRNGGDWPRPGFTLAENIADLRVHEAEHAASVAFTYTVEDPAGTRTLGCVYVQPFEKVAARAGADTVSVSGVAAPDPVVSFWVRPDGPPGLVGRLLGALQRWFADDWPYPRVLFVANAAEGAMRDSLMRGGLIPEAGFVASDGERYLLHRAASSASVVRRRVVVSGHVQGVFFRDTCVEVAVAHGVAGSVRNLPDGRVEAVFEGPPDGVAAVVGWCWHGPRGAAVRDLRVAVETPAGDRGFVVH